MVSALVHLDHAELANQTDAARSLALSAPLIAQAMGQTDLERRAATVNEAQRQLRSYRAPASAAVAAAPASAPAAGSGDADFQYSLLTILRRGGYGPLVGLCWVLKERFGH